MADQEEQTEQGGEEAAPAGAEATDEATQEQQTEESGVSVAEPEEAAATKGADVVAEQAALREDVLEAEEGRNMRKERVGTVVSDKMEKTIVVRIERSQKHPMYKKYLTRSARKMTHDENDEAGEGDTVRIMETRPISKRKRWRLVEILERAA